MGWVKGHPINVDARDDALYASSDRRLHCKAHEVDFRSTNLSEASLCFTDFSYSQFHQINLYKADFEDAFHYAIDIFSNKIKGARFSRDEAVSLLEGLEIELI